MLSDDSDQCNKEDSEELGYESGSSGTLGIRLGGLLRDVGFNLGVMLSANASCDCDWGSLDFP